MSGGDPAPPPWRATFEALVRAGGGEAPIPLAEAAFVVSAALQGDDTWAIAPARLLQLQHDARDRVGDDDDPIAGAEAVMAVLREAGLRGNADDYDDPRNSFLDRVLERGLGLPITLGVIAMEVARAADVPLRGISFPGHFLVGVELDELAPSVYDPFRGGLECSMLDLAELYTATTGHAVDPGAPALRARLRPASSREVLSRLLRNLQRRYAEDGALERLTDVVEMLAIVHPEVDALHTTLRALKAQRRRPG